MEKSVRIKKSDCSSGVYIELDCCMCSESKTYAASTVKELLQIVKDEGWTELHSDLYKVRGHWCGCNYKD